MKIISNIGSYTILMARVLKKPDKGNIFRKKILIEMDSLGLNSLGIIAYISIFMGAILAIQTASQTDNPLYPGYLIGFAVRESILLEFSPTIISLILAGKIGSSVASEIGTMKVTEQIDALEIMGINSANFLIAPKLIAAIIINPLLIIISIFLGIIGGWLAAVFAGVVNPQEYLQGIQMWFVPFEVFYALLKTVVFAIIIITVSAYHAYYIKGGAIDVGKASTKAVVYSSILIILFNLILTQLLLV
ncbi:MAG: ABC transporter permease [Bacteroidota bacterium]|nr:ABC transporter permease [Bacteroidota bacterium]